MIESPFLKCHSDFHNIYYDEDLVVIRRKVNELHDILKEMYMRFERHESLQIAKSVFDYLSQKDQYAAYPHMYYDFRVGDTRISVACKKSHGKRHYFVNVVGFRPDEFRFNPHISEFGYGDFESVEASLPLFFEIVRDFILPRLSALF